jgi:hypothetical protein
VTLLRYAVDYAIVGWPVIPLLGKIPATRHGSKDHMVDIAKIATHSWPGIGLCTGHAFFVVDVDGEDGKRSLIRALGEDEMPQTPTAKTRNGMHFYFALPRCEVKNRTGLLPGIDIRGTGGYVVAPPSPHPDGGSYSWLIDYRSAPLAVPPAWLRALLFPPKKKRTPTPSTDDVEFDLARVSTIHCGTRNGRLYKLACAAFAKGKSIETVTSELQWLNENRCVDPLSERELDAIARSASRHSI